jgi:7-keto-8-aminopelargonate synthetase-like enzyme
MAMKLGEWLNQSKKFDLLAPVTMNVACFTLSGNVSAEVIQSFLDKIRVDGRAFFTPTNYKGRPAIRAAVSNWLTSVKDIDITIEALDELA